MAQKPSIPKGTRDFSPVEVSRREYIIQTIKSHFKNFGFQPIETPSFEKSSTLLGKYGEEGDRLIFKILNSGASFDRPQKELVDINIIEFTVFVELVEFLVDDFLKGAVRDSGELYEKSFCLIAGDDPMPNARNLIDKSKFISNISEYKDDLFNHIEYLADFYNNQSSLDRFIKIKKNSSILDFYTTRFIRNNSVSVAEKALKYDLTVPFARYVVQHQHELVFPFKRYQVQPVWRADRPQKGRFREFVQCDADVIGSDSLWQEVEFVMLYDQVFHALQLNGITIKLNNRKILSGFAEVIEEQDKLIDFTVALDKLDKIGEEGVKKEMFEKGIAEEAIAKIQPIFSFSGDFKEKIDQLKDILSTSKIGLEGVEELTFVHQALEDYDFKSATLDLDVTLARGLNYYTGAIFEISAPENVKIGSIGGGGRYDDLTGIFGLKNMSGVGISFGLDRIYLVLEELNLFPETVADSTQILFINFGFEESKYAMKAIMKLRQKEIKAELYPDDTKFKKQMQYADKRGIKYAVIAGESEIEKQAFNLKNLETGDQELVDLETILSKFASQ